MAVRTARPDRRRHLRRAMQHLHHQRLRARRHADDRRSRPGRDPCCHHHVLPDIERQSCRGTDAAAPVAAGDRQVVRVAAATDRGLVAGKTIGGAVGRVIEGAWQLRGLHAVQVGSLRSVAGDAGARSRRPGGPMRKRAAHPVLRSAPGAGARAGVAGGAIQAIAVCVAENIASIVERSARVGGALPVGRRGGSFAPVARDAARRCRAAGEVELASSP